MLLDHCYAYPFVAVAFQFKEEVFWRGPLWPFFAKPLIRPSANLAKTISHMCEAMSSSSLPSFVNIHQAILQ